MALNSRSQGCAGPPGILLLQPPNARMTGMHNCASRISFSFFFFFNCMQSATQRKAVRRETHTLQRCCVVWAGSTSEVPGQPSSPQNPPQVPNAPQETPPLRLLYQRQEAGPKPREGTTQTAIISSLAKTSNSPNYPGKEKKHKMKTN